MLVPSLQLRLHTIAAGAGAVWAGDKVAIVLMVLEGIGKVTMDGSSQRMAGPCSISVPPDAAVRIANQGELQMRVLEVLAGVPADPALPVPR